VSGEGRGWGRVRDGWEGRDGGGDRGKGERVGRGRKRLWRSGECTDILRKRTPSLVQNESANLISWTLVGEAEQQDEQYMFLELLVTQQSKHLLPAVGGYGLECPTPMPNVEYILSNSSIKMSCMKMLVVIQWDPSNTDTLGSLKCALIRGVSSFQGANNTYLYEVGIWSSVLIREVSSFQVSFKRGSTVNFF